MKFIDAMSLLKEGKKIRRQSWYLDRYWALGKCLEPSDDINPETIYEVAESVGTIRDVDGVYFTDSVIYADDWEIFTGYQKPKEDNCYTIRILEDSSVTIESGMYGAKLSENGVRELNGETKVLLQYDRVPVRELIVALSHISEEYRTKDNRSVNRIKSIEKSNTQGEIEFRVNKHEEDPDIQLTPSGEDLDNYLDSKPIITQIKEV